MPEAKQNKRLLTPSEQIVVLKAFCKEHKVTAVLCDAGFLEANLKAQDAQTLKEVGEWLVDKDILEINDGIQYFLRGEMPG